MSNDNLKIKLFQKQTIYKLQSLSLIELDICKYHNLILMIKETHFAEFLYILFKYS